VLTRSAALPYLARVTVAPITSTLRGVPSEVSLGIDDGMKQPCAVNLFNLVTVDKGGLGRRLTQLRPSKVEEVCTAIRFSLGCDEGL
jgi:mRNA interferase MazF